MTEADLIVRDLGNPVAMNARTTGWWAAKCRHCGNWLTKYAWTRDDAVREALSEPHACRRQ